MFWTIVGAIIASVVILIIFGIVLLGIGAWLDRVNHRERVPLSWRDGEGPPHVKRYTGTKLDKPRCTFLALIVIYLVGLLIVRAAGAAEFDVRQPIWLRGNYGVHVRGPIHEQDDVMFKRITQGLGNDVTLILRSPGGASGAAMRIGSFIRMNYWTTVVLDEDPCNSACSIIWLSGMHRWLGPNARVGVHIMARADGSGIRSDWGNGIIAGFLRSMDIPEEVIERMVKTDPCCFDYIGYHDAMALGLLNPRSDQPKGR
jgi:hypothetical protein